jgi:hypothetical protein
MKILPGDLRFSEVDVGGRAAGKRSRSALVIANRHDELMLVIVTVDGSIILKKGSAAFAKYFFNTTP